MGSITQGKLDIFGPCDTCISVEECAGKMRCVHVAIQKEAEALRAMESGKQKAALDVLNTSDLDPALKAALGEAFQRVSKPPENFQVRLATDQPKAVNNPVQAHAAARAAVTPRWQAYLRIPGKVRVLYYGEELEGVESVNIRSEPGGRVVMTLEVVVESDSYIQIKGADNDYRTRKG